MRKSVVVALTAVFAAVHAVLYFASFGLWRNWAIYLAPIEGIVLGPVAGFSASLIGGLTARMIRPDEFWMFGIVAEPASVMATGLLCRGRWKPVMVAYAVMLSAYFLHPFGRALPLWAILDVLAAFLLIYATAKLSKGLPDMDFARLPLVLALISFVCIATDSLVRIFLLVPCGFYMLFPGFFGTFEGLYIAFAGAALYSYAEDLLVVVVSLVAGVPILKALSKLDLFGNKRRESKDEVRLC